jgi:hypothetical protein
LIGIDAKIVVPIQQAAGNNRSNSVGEKMLLLQWVTCGYFH